MNDRDEEIDQRGPGFEPIQGVSLERYADLAALMAGAGGDPAKCAQIVEAQALSAGQWEAARSGWTERMRDPAFHNRVAFAFIPLYQAALARHTGGAEPISLAEFARITAEYSFRRDPADSERQIDYKVVLEENGLDVIRWTQISTYWTPRVNDPDHPAAAEFKNLMKQAADRLQDSRA